MFHQQKPEQPDEREELSAELAALERGLAALTPAAIHCNRDRLMFDAGFAAAAARAPALPPPRFWSARIWPMMTVVSTAASITLAILLIQQPPTDAPGVAIRPQVIVDAVVPSPVHAQLVSAAPAAGTWPAFLPAWLAPVPPTSGYLARRNAVLVLGPAALEGENTRLSASGNGNGPPRPTTARELLEEYLPPSALLPNDQVLMP
jgi:hypothetical protein